MNEANLSSYTRPPLSINKLSPLTLQRVQLLIDIVDLKANMMNALPSSLQELGHATLGVDRLQKLERKAQKKVLRKVAYPSCRRIRVILRNGCPP